MTLRLNDDPRLVVRVIHAAAALTVNVLDLAHPNRRLVNHAVRRLIVNVNRRLADRDPIPAVPVVPATGPVPVAADHHHARAIPVVFVAPWTANVGTLDVYDLTRAIVVIVIMHRATGQQATDNKQAAYS
jgi:hypothetical protein